MKVTVCFGNVWVVVPCGDGLHSVQDLMSRAALRYRKASGQPNDSWVTVHALKSLDGGLLDPDDRVCDVTDDREQLVAEYGVSAATSTAFGLAPSAGSVARSVGGGSSSRGYPTVADGTSASSDEASRSPIPFTNGDHRFQPFSRVDIEVTGCESDHSSSLQVRRGSESALNQLQSTAASVVVASTASADQLADISCKRWSAAPIIDDQVQAQSTPIKRPPPGEREEASGDERERAALPVPPYKDTGHFRRNFLRLSMQTSGLNGSGRWSEAADRILPVDSSLHHDHHQRWEPVGRSSSRASADPCYSDCLDGAGLSRCPPTARSTTGGTTDDEAPFRELVVLSQVSGSLGIHVVPDPGSLWSGGDRLGTASGLRVQYIEPDGIVDRDARIRVGDIIAEINATPLRNISFQKAQEIFIAAAKTGEMRLMVDHVSAGDSSTGKITCPGHLRDRAGDCPVSRDYLPPRPVFPRSASDLSIRDVRGVPNIQLSRVAAVSPTKKQQQSARPSSCVVGSVTGGGAGGLLAANTRRLGRRLSVRLLKTAAGLGFSLTTRDNQAAGPAPIYIKNIQPQGAAIEDGTLRPGDRLLEVNGSPVSGLSQHQVVQLLRAVEIGQSVHLTVSRQELTAGTRTAPIPAGTPAVVVSDESEPSAAADMKRDTDSSSPRLPRPLPDDPMEDMDVESGVFSHLEACDILTLDIPAHDSERAGLGVSVKGKTTPAPAEINGVSAGRIPSSGSDGGAVSEGVSNNGGGAAGGGCDAGIFVKSVMCGGAAGKDGRLQRNDQLLKINGVSLLGLSNRQAMETLRRAMYQRSEGLGVISLVVARRKDVCTSASSGRESVNSMLSSSSGELLTGWRTVSGGDDTSSRIADTADADTAPDSSIPRHSALDRVAALANRANLRNDSYCRATHETSWSSPQVNNNNNDNNQSILSASSPGSPSQPFPGSSPEGAKTGPGDISTDGDVAYASQLSLDHAGVGFTRDQPGRRSMSEKRHASRDAKSTDTYQRTRRARDDRQRQRQLMASQLSAQSAAVAATGAPFLYQKRRSQSHHHLDMADRLTTLVESSGDDIGPNLGMKKSSSLESLQTMVHELVMEEDRVPSGSGAPVVAGVTHSVVGGASGGTVTVVPIGPRHGVGKSPSGVQVVRGRGCNESFRAAVDRSYDAPLGPDLAPLSIRTGQMETLDEYVDNHFVRDRAVRHSSLSSGAVEGKKGKRRSTLLKGLGSMFGFGRQTRGKPDVSLASLSPQVTLATTLPRPASAAGAPLSSDQLRAQQAQLNRAVTRQLAEQQQQHQQQQLNGGDQHVTSVDIRPMPNTANVPAPAPVSSQPPVSRGSSSPPGMSGGEGAPDMSRRDRITQLRHQHQRMHASRSGVYVTDAAEERAERHMRQMLSSEADTGVPTHPTHLAVPHPHQLSHSIEDRVNNNVPPQQIDQQQQQQHGLKPVAGQQQISPQANGRVPPWLPTQQQRYGMSDTSFINTTDPLPVYGQPYNAHPQHNNTSNNSNSTVVCVQQHLHQQPRLPVTYRSVSNFRSSPVPNIVSSFDYDQSSKLLIRELENIFKRSANSRHQVYRSQRGTRSGASSELRQQQQQQHQQHHHQLRPGSNYYEYESVQAMLRLGGGGGNAPGGVSRPPMPPGSVHHRSLPRVGVRHHRNQPMTVPSNQQQHQNQNQQRQFPPHPLQHQHERTSSVPVSLHCSQGSRNAPSTLVTVPRRGHVPVPPPPPRPTHMKFSRQSDTPFQPGSHV